MFSVSIFYSNGCFVSPYYYICAKMGKMMWRYIFIGLVISTFYSCSGIKRVKKFNKEKAVVALKKEAPSGPYSVYDLYVYRNGWAIYEGFAHVEKYGIYAKKMTKKEVEAIKVAFDDSDFFGFKENYAIPSPDLPVITLIYNKHKDRKKSVTGSLARPRKLIELQLMLEKIAKSPDMIPVEMIESVRKTDAVEEEWVVNPDYKIKSEIIIESKPGVFMAQWLKKYAEYDINLVSKLSGEQSLWLITFNLQKISPEDMLEKLQNDPSVTKAEFNKRITPRNK